MKRAIFAALGVAISCSAFAFASCSREPAKDTRAVAECACTGDPVVDPTLLAFLSKARSAHHQADLAQDAGDARRAVAALVRVTDGPVPHNPKGAKAPPPEVAEVLADTRARLAGLRAELGDFDAASRDIDAGLALAEKPTHFRGHLFEVRGVVLERRSKKLKEQGDTAGAEQARAAALEAFDTAIKIQDEVIAEALRSVDAGAPR